MKGLHTGGFDIRITIYRSVKLLLVAALLAAVVKTTLFDTVRCAGGQMEPTIIRGDRLLVFKTRAVGLLRRAFGPPYDKVIAYRNPYQPGTIGILRVAACSGDTIGIDSGKVSSNRPLPRTHPFDTSLSEIVPAEYSPRDFFRPYQVPGKGDLLQLNRLSLRDFFFARSIVGQEHPGQPVTVKPYLLLDDSTCGTYTVTDFTLYRGLLDSVPDSLRYNWFFWDRMEEYLFQKHDTRKVSLFFTLIHDGTELTEYRVRDGYYFLLADNRKTGYDCRYTGPVRKSFCIGTASLVLWSHGKNNRGKRQFRFNRLGKIVR